jgi:hypothetical protein
MIKIDVKGTTKMKHGGFSIDLPIELNYNLRELLSMSTNEEKIPCNV